jgi:hypothetical protein
VAAAVGAAESFAWVARRSRRPATTADFVAEVAERVQAAGELRPAYDAAGAERQCAPMRRLLCGRLLT